MLLKHESRSRVGQIELLAGSSWLVFLILIILAGYLYLNPNIFFPKEPRSVPLLAGADLMERLQEEKEPVFVFFYHSPSGVSARTYFPILEDLAQRFGNKVRFYRYQASPKYPDQYFNEFWRYDSVFALFQNAQEIRRAPLVISSLAVANQGFAFLVIKDHLGLRRPLVAGREAPGAQLITADDFRPAVLASTGYSIVLFTSPHCPAARRFQPDFERVAAANGDLAEFFVLDVTAAGGSEVQGRYAGRSTPTVAIFYQGAFQGKFSGGFNDPNANESAILGLLVPYL